MVLFNLWASLIYINLGPCVKSNEWCLCFSSQTSPCGLNYKFSTLYRGTSSHFQRETQSTVLVVRNNVGYEVLLCLDATQSNYKKQGILYYKGSNFEIYPLDGAFLKG